MVSASQRPFPLRLQVLRVLSGSLVGLALFVLLVPFDVRIPLSDVRITGGASYVNADCRAPLFSVWHRGAKGQVGVWVTGTRDEPGFAVRVGAKPWCAEEARVRLAIVFGLFGTGATAFAIARRKGTLSRPDASSAEDA